MKRTWLIISVILALVIVPVSCIYDRVNDWESESIQDPDDNISDENTDYLIKRTFQYTFITSKIENVSSYAYPDLTTAPPVFRFDSAEYVGLWLTGEKNTAIYQNRKIALNDDEAAKGDTISTVTDTLTTRLKKAVSFSYYPYQSSGVSSTTVSYSLNPVQNQSADSASEKSVSGAVCKNLFMVSNLSDTFSLDKGTGQMYLKNIFSMLRFQVKKDASFTEFSSQKIKRIQVYVVKKNDIAKPLDKYILAGNYTVDVSKGHSATPVFDAGAGKSSNTITASITGGSEIGSSSGPYIWLTVNTLKIASDECLLSVVETEAWKIYTKHNVTELKPDNVYTFNITAKKTSAGDSYTVPADDVVVNSFSQAANCYIISKPGLSRIPMRTISNTPALAGTKADWLWASKIGGGNAFSITELIDTTKFAIVDAGGNKYVQFKVGTQFGEYTEGNVIIALKNNSGDIVWSWHIWITDQPDDIVFPSGKYFLDRNLGALSAKLTDADIDRYGFLYQWGRKDPFIGGDGKKNETASASDLLSLAKANTILNKVSWGALAGNSSYGKIDFSVKNPTQFIYSSQYNESSGYADWIADKTDGDTARWYLPHPYKTDYDPCPPNYRVPDRQDFEELHAAYAKPTPTFNNISYKTWEYVISTGISAYFPVTGYRYGRNVTGVNVGGQLISSGTDTKAGSMAYWTRTPARKSGTNGGSYRLYSSDITLYSADEFTDNADALAVRCIKY